jgi:Family of unknown function (DUF6502)
VVCVKNAAKHEFRLKTPFFGGSLRFGNPRCRVQIKPCRKIGNNLKRATGNNSSQRGQELDTNPKAAVARAAMALFEPLAHLFVEFGMTSPEAESLLRSVLVHAVASRTDRDKPMTQSRTALLSGVHRNEVRRILDAPPGIDPGREMRRHRANRILAAWHDDPKYTDDEGLPKDLDLKPEKSRRKKQARPENRQKSRKKNPIHFWGLVQKYAPGVWPQLILDELLGVGAVRQLENGKLKVQMRSYGVCGVQLEAIEEIGHRVRDLLGTLIHNLKEPSIPRLCETVFALDVDPKWLPVLRGILQQRTRAFLTGVAADLNNQRAQRSADDRSKSDVHRVGVTVYSIEKMEPVESTEVMEEQQKEGLKNDATKRRKQSSPEEKKPAI